MAIAGSVSSVLFRSKSLQLSLDLSRSPPLEDRAAAAVAGKSRRLEQSAGVAEAVAVAGKSRCLSLGIATPKFVVATGRFGVDAGDQCYLHWEKAAAALAFGAAAAFDSRFISESMENEIEKMLGWFMKNQKLANFNDEFLSGILLVMNALVEELLLSAISLTPLHYSWCFFSFLFSNCFINLFFLYCIMM